MDILITTNINNGRIECLINNFWIFYYNNTQDTENAKLNKIIFDKFIDRLSRYSGNSTVNINMIKLLFSVQTDILYNNYKINNLRNIQQLSLIFDAINISDIIKSEIVFTGRREYFGGKDMAYEIAENILEGIVIDKKEFLTNTINSQNFYRNDITEKINLKLALIQKEYLENIIRRLINKKFRFYNNNKDTIIEHITNFFEKKPENRFIIDLHSMMQFDTLNIEGNMIIITVMALNMTNPFIINLMTKYPKEDYDAALPALQASPRNAPNNCPDIQAILHYLQMARNPQNNNEYLSMIRNTAELPDRTRRPYIDVLEELIAANRNTLLAKQIQTILAYYAGNRQNGGYHKKYLKYKEKYLRLLNKINM